MSEDALEKSVSPFSLSRSWALYWTRLPSNFKRMEHFNGESQKELLAIQALATVGVIGGQQLQRIFSIDKKRLKSMTIEQKIVRHEIKSGNQIIPIYTLGMNGAVMAGIEDSYALNYWVSYKTEDVLKRILYFQLYKHFDTGSSQSMAHPTPKPFVGAITLRDKPFYVYVVRGDTNDLNMFLKWNEGFNERVIVLTESLRHLEPLKWVLSNLKVRIAVDADLMSEVEHIQNLFYFMEEGEFVRETVKD